MNRLSPATAALTSALIGFGGTLALVLAAAQAIGASNAQTASWVTVICFAIAIESLALSLWYRMPMVTAWSSAGLALIGTSTGFGVNEAVGAFLMTAVLVMATGLLRPLARLVSKIPAGLSAGMLAGVLLPFVLAGAQSTTVDPVFALSLATGFFVLRLWNPSLAIIAVLIIGIIWAIVSQRTSADFSFVPTQIAFVAPTFSLAGFFGLSIPLYIVTMASQNLPGLAVLRADGYEPPAGPPIALTGALSFVSGFFGASTTNLSAITAAICTGPEAHPDPDKRWVVGLWYSGLYAIFGFFGASLIALVSIMPGALIALALGLALLAPLVNATRIAMADERDRFAAITTLAVTASGVAFAGIGAAFWGLSVGLIIHGLDRLRSK